MIYIHDIYMCTLYMYVNTHIHTRAETKFGMFEPLFVCCALEAKFLPSKLRCQSATPTLMFAHGTSTI